MIQKILLLILVNFIGAVTYPIGKLSFAYGHPIFLTGIRMVLAGFGLLFFVFFTDKKTVGRFSKKVVYLLIGLSLCNVFLTNWLQFWALQYTTAGKAIFIFNMSPFIAALFSYFIYNERMTIKKLLALIISFVGFLPILISNAYDHIPLKHFLFINIAEVALLLAAIISVIGWFIMKELLQTSNCSLVFANGLSMLAGGIVFFPISYLSEGANWYSITHVYKISGLLAVLIIANNIINYNAYAYFLRHISATLIFLISFTGPLFALFFGWLFLGEKIGISFLITIIVVGIGLAMYYQEEKRLLADKTLNQLKAK